MKQKTFLSFILFAGIFLFVKCSGEHEDADHEKEETASKFGGFESQVKWGEHIVKVSGCHDCHTPKKMTEQGPTEDYSRELSGHPADAPAPDVDRKDAESKGLIITQDLTSWVGPWGVSFTANLTPDDTGIGNWTEEQFMRAIREGKSKGLEENRSLLPPMPWQMIRNMTDDELKAIFAYLKSIPPIKNLVPQPIPPVSAPAH